MQNLSAIVSRARAELAGVAVDLQLDQPVSRYAAQAIADVSCALWSERANARLAARQSANTPW